MTAHQGRVPPFVVWALGLTQIIGYGTLYYSFAILAPAMSIDFDLPEQWIFGALSGALFLGSLVAPIAGRLADRFGSGNVMALGSLAASVAMIACANSPNLYVLMVSLVAMEVSSAFVLYATAFIAVVQVGAASAQRSITHLTLIGGFASTFFWPITTLLHESFDWRQVYLIFAALNLLVCMPLHLWVARARRSAIASQTCDPQPLQPGLKEKRTGSSTAFCLMIAAFAVEGFVLSAVLFHMVPLVSALTLGAAGAFVPALFGPAQVASRLINMIFGDRLKQTCLAIIASTSLVVAFLLSATTHPQIWGAVVFVIFMGFGSGLVSIIIGTLPLEVFGRDGYGGNVGWMSAARQFSSSFAPFALAALMASRDIGTTMLVLVFAATLGVALFFAIAWHQADRRRLFP